MFESGSFTRLFQLTIIRSFSFCWWNVSDGFQQSAVVEPVNPLQRGILNGIQSPSWATMMDHLRFEQADDGFSQRIVVGVAGGAD